MFHKIVREAHFNLIKTKLTPFRYLPREFHDPTLDFKTRLHRYITEEDKAQGLSSSPWIGILWKRDVLTIPEELSEARKFKIRKDVTTDIDKPTAEVFQYRQASCSMSLAIYSFDADYLETFEENMFLLFEPIHPLDVIYPMLDPVNPITILVNNFKRTTFTKEPREGDGTLAKLSLTYDLIYPIVRTEGTIKLIKNIVFDVKVVNTFD